MTKSTLLPLLMLMVLTILNPKAIADCDAVLLPLSARLKSNGWAIQYIPTDVYYKFRDNKELSEEELKYLGILKDDQTYQSLFGPNEFLLLRDEKLKEQDVSIQNDGEHDLAFQIKPRWIKEPVRGVQRTYGEPYLQRVELPEYDENRRVKFRNLAQKLYHLIGMDPNIPMVIAMGGAGSGKTHGALVSGATLMERGKKKPGTGEFHSKGPRKGNTNISVPFVSPVQKDFKPIFEIHSVKDILVTRRPKEMGDPLGFLPGDEIEKMLPFLRPLITNYLEITRQKANERSFTDATQLPQGLNLLPYSHIRGATVLKSAMIIDEAQNVPEHDLRTFITRTGEGSKFFLTGDDGQIDDPENLNYQNNALAVTWQMSRENFIWTTARIRLPDSVRSEVAYVWQKLWDAKDAKARAQNEAAKAADPAQ